MFVGDCYYLDDAIIVGCCYLLCFFIVFLLVFTAVILFYCVNLLPHCAYLPLHVPLVYEKTHTDQQSIWLIRIINPYGIFLKKIDFSVCEKPIWIGDPYDLYRLTIRMSFFYKKIDFY